MNSGWGVERWRLFSLLVVILVLGGLTGAWLIATILPTGLYIGWQMLQLYRLDKWLENGYKPGHYPNSSGVWESIITQVIKLRKQDRRHKKNLTKVAKGYRNAIKALPDAAIVVNRSFEIEWLNQTAEQFFGLHAKQDIGQAITNLIRTPEFSHYLTTPRQKPLEIEAPGSPGMVLSLRIVRYGQNQRLILGRDISEPLRARRALQAFVSNASHELRTPLTVTSGYIEMLQDDPDTPESFRQPLAQLNEQTQRMTALINDLLTLSKLEGGDLKSDEGQLLDVAAMLRQAVQYMHNSGITQQHSIKLDTDSNLGMLGIEGDVISVYSNLIENACKYTPPDTEIKIRWWKDSSGKACLQVSDSGPGFDAGSANEITQRFYRLNNQATSATEGTGLGLAIVKYAAMRHGGKLDIKSQPGIGSRFTVSFPATRSRAI